MTTYVCSPAVFSVFGAVYLTYLLLCFATALEMGELKKKIPWLFDRKQLTGWVQGENESPYWVKNMNAVVIPGCECS